MKNVLTVSGTSLLAFASVVAISSSAQAAPYPDGNLWGAAQVCGISTAGLSYSNDPTFQNALQNALRSRQNCAQVAYTVSSAISQNGYYGAYPGQNAYANGYGNPYYAQYGNYSQYNNPNYSQYGNSNYPRYGNSNYPRYRNPNYSGSSPYVFHQRRGRDWDHDGDGGREREH